MAYVYLLDLHQMIDRRLAEAMQAVDKAIENYDEIKFHQGRIVVLSDFKDFITQNLNSKLPGRIRKKYFGTK